MGIKTGIKSKEALRRSYLNPSIENGLTLFYKPSLPAFFNRDFAPFKKVFKVL